MICLDAAILDAATVIHKKNGRNNIAPTVFVSG